MIKRIGNVLGRKLVEGAFFSAIFAGIQRIIVGIFYVIYKLIEAVLGLVFKIIIKVFSYLDALLAILARYVVQNIHR